MSSHKYTIQYTSNETHKCKACNMLFRANTIKIQETPDFYYHPACIQPVPYIEEFAGWEILTSEDKLILYKILKINYFGWTNLMLKNRLASLSLRVGGRKQILVNRLYEYEEDFLNALP